MCNRLPLGAKVAIMAKLPTKLGIASGIVKSMVHNLLPGRSVFTVRSAEITAIMADRAVTTNVIRTVFANVSSVR